MTLEAIGQKLKAARESQGLSLRQIYERTKIPINHLQAIDAGTPDDLPEAVYVAGFIKRYAECIGLDGQVLADEYRREEAHNNGNGRAKATPQQVYVTPEYLKHAKIDNRPPTYKLWPFYIVAIVVLMVVLSWYSSQQTNTANQPDPYNLSLKDSAAQLHGGQPGITAATPSGTGVAVAPGQDDKLVLSANRHVWIDVRKLASGESIFTGYLEQGDRREYSDPQGLRVNVGNGASVTAEFKGKMEPFGVAGKPIERTFVTQSAVAATDPAQAGTAVGTPTGTSSTLSASSIKPVVKRVRKPTDSASSAPRRYRSLDDGGGRSIYGSGGSRDVPYRYSEGRLDAN